MATQFIGLYVVLFAALFGCESQHAESPVRTNPNPEVAPSPRRVKPYRTNRHLDGAIVQGVSDSLLLIKRGDGQTQRFIVGDGLRSSLLRYRIVPQTYRVSDTVIGDVVNLEYNSFLFVDVAEVLTIRRRPGGRVPVAPGDDPDDNWAHHVRMNAMQDFEEKGIPIPKRFALDKTFGRFNGVPITPEMLPPVEFQNGLPKLTTAPKPLAPPNPGK